MIFCYILEATQTADRLGHSLSKHDTRCFWETIKLDASLECLTLCPIKILMGPVLPDNQQTFHDRVSNINNWSGLFLCLVGVTRKRIPVCVPGLPQLCLWEVEFYFVSVPLEQYAAFSAALEQRQIHSPVAQNLFPELLTRQYLANQVFWIEKETKTFQDEMYSFSAMNAMDQEDHEHCLPLQRHPSSHDPMHKYWTKE